MGEGAPYVLSRQCGARIRAACALSGTAWVAEDGRRRLGVWAAACVAGLGEGCGAAEAQSGGWARGEARLRGTDAEG